MFNDSGIKVFVMDGPIDVPFMQMIEVKSKEKVRFVRVDSDGPTPLNQTLTNQERNWTALVHHWKNTLRWRPTTRS